MSLECLAVSEESKEQEALKQFLEEPEEAGVRLRNRSLSNGGPLNPLKVLVLFFVSSRVV